MTPFYTHLAGVPGFGVQSNVDNVGASGRRRRRRRLRRPRADPDRQALPAARGGGRDGREGGTSHDPRRRRPRHPHRGAPAHRGGGRRRPGDGRLGPPPPCSAASRRSSRGATRATPGSSPSASAASAPRCTAIASHPRRRERPRRQIRRQRAPAPQPDHGLADASRTTSSTSTTCTPSTGSTSSTPSRPIPGKTSALAESISDWPKSSPRYFAGVKDRVGAFVKRGQLGPFANAYWGHPAYKLPPEANLHRPSPTTSRRSTGSASSSGCTPSSAARTRTRRRFLVGGMATPDRPRPARTRSTPTSIAEIATADRRRRKEFVDQVYIPDLLAVASFYKDWAGIGGGVGNFLVYGDYPMDDGAESPSCSCPRGVIRNRDLCQGRALRRPEDHRVRHPLLVHLRGRRRQGAAPLRRRDQAQLHRPEAPVRPPRHRTASTAGSRRRATTTCRWRSARWRGCWSPTPPVTSGSRRSSTVCSPSSASGPRPSSPPSAGWRRGASRRRCSPRRCRAGSTSWSPTPAAATSRSPTTSKWDPHSWPRRGAGAGLHEAPRGALGHWVQIENGAITQLPGVVPSTWNAGPRDPAGKRGPYEEALVGTPVANPTSRWRSCAPSTRSTPASPAGSTWSTPPGTRW